METRYYYTSPQIFTNQSENLYNMRNRQNSDSEERPLTSTGRRNPRRNQEEILSEESSSNMSRLLENMESNSFQSFSLPLFTDVSILNFLAANSNVISFPDQLHLQDEVHQGLPKEYMDKIKKMKMGGTKRDCSVCYGGFQRGEKIRKLPCKHIFHDDCISPWLEKNITCPNCRLNLVEYFNEHPDGDY